MLDFYLEQKCCGGYHGRPQTLGFADADDGWQIGGFIWEFFNCERYKIDDLDMYSFWRLIRKK